MCRLVYAAQHIVRLQYRNSITKRSVGPRHGTTFLLPGRVLAHVNADVQSVLCPCDSTMFLTLGWTALNPLSVKFLLDF